MNYKHQEIFDSKIIFVESHQEAQHRAWSRQPVYVCNNNIDAICGREINENSPYIYVQYGTDIKYLMPQIRPLTKDKTK